MAPAMRRGGKQPRNGLRLDDADVGQGPALLNDVVAQVRHRHARPYCLQARHESPASGYIREKPECARAQDTCGRQPFCIVVG